MRKIGFLELVSGSEMVKEDRLAHLIFAEFEVISVNRRFGAVLCRYIEPGASGSQDVQDPLISPRGSHRGRPICGFVGGR